MKWIDYWRQITSKTSALEKADNKAKVANWAWIPVLLMAYFAAKYVNENILSRGPNAASSGPNFIGSILTPDSGKLTEAKAQRAIDSWKSFGSGAITVSGIQEFPQQNSARADIYFNNFRWTGQDDFGLRTPKAREYSGPGQAFFTRYNDGRWILTQVYTSQGYQSIWWEGLTVEAK